MKIYYFVHIVGRDEGNSGIPRVSRNLGRALEGISGVTLVPVRWDAALSAIVHAENEFLDTMIMHGGPRLVSGKAVGQAIHRDADPGDWVLVPEVTHLGTPDPAYPSFQFPLLVGYARQHNFRVAAIFHDAMPLTHFGEEEDNGHNALSFMAYTFGLSECDIILPVSRASGCALTALFARYGIAPRPDRILEPILLPEEMIGTAKLKYLPRKFPDLSDEISFCMWGTIFPHKNYMTAMTAFNKLCNRWPERNLILNHVGSVSSACVAGVARLVRHSKGRIHLHGFVSDEDLAFIVRSSCASIFISRAEGYGLPLSESLWLGLPCITSDIIPMTEIAAGGGALLVDPRDIDSIVDGMETFINNPIECRRLHDELRTRRFRTWDRYAQDVLEVIVGSNHNKVVGIKRSLTYTPTLSRCLDSGFEVLAYDMNEMSTPSDYENAGVPLVSGSTLSYERNTHGPVDHSVICFGPYVTLGPGRYVITFDGTIDGTCLLRVTSDAGQKMHLEMIVHSVEVAPEFVVDAQINKCEILFIKTPDLKSLSIETIWITRYFL